MKRYRLSVTVRAPVLTAETSMGAYGIDTPVARDFDRTPYIPGSHMRGKLREALDQLKEAGAAVWDPDDLFGKADGASRGKGEDVRARVYIGDLRAETPEDDRLGTIVWVAVDDLTGAVEEGALLVAECPWKPGRPVTFAGTLVVDGDDAAHRVGAPQQLLQPLFDDGRPRRRQDQLDRARASVPVVEHPEPLVRQVGDRPGQQQIAVGAQPVVGRRDGEQQPAPVGLGRLSAHGQHFRHGGEARDPVLRAAGRQALARGFRARPLVVPDGARNAGGHGSGPAQDVDAAPGEGQNLRPSLLVEQPAAEQPLELHQPRTGTVGVQAPVQHEPPFVEDGDLPAREVEPPFQHRIGTDEHHPLRQAPELRAGQRPGPLRRDRTLPNRRHTGFGEQFEARPRMCVVHPDQIEHPSPPAVAGHPTADDSTGP